MGTAELRQCVNGTATHHRTQCADMIIVVQSLQCTFLGGQGRDCVRTKERKLLFNTQTCYS